MTTSLRSQGAAAVLLAALASPAAAQEGRLAGFVEDTRGAPVAGAVISLFGKGLERGGLITFSDSAGRFTLPSLPAGSYTLRALGGQLRAPARQVTVLPGQESVFSVSLAASDDSAEEEEAARNEKPAVRELRWLLRHRRRSVLEERQRALEPVHDPNATPTAPDFLPDVDGTVEIVADAWSLGGPTTDTDDSVPTSLGLVRLQGRFADFGHWSLGGFLAESETATWRMAAEFVVEPGGGHEVRVGTGYGSRLVRPLVPGPGAVNPDNRSQGAIFVEEHWQVSRNVAATLGGRYSYIGFLADGNHLDPMGSLELNAGSSTRIRGTWTTRTMPPGGDLLTISTLASAPAIAYAMMADGLRPERLVRYELTVDRTEGPATLGAHALYEGAEDQLLNVFAGARSARTLRISNARTLRARGAGVSLSRRFGDAVEGSITYTYGRTWRRGETSRGLPALGPFLSSEENNFHDLVGRLETVIEGTGTRVSAFYRINTLSPIAGRRGTQGFTNRRFDVQLRQGLPLLHSLTRAEWDLILAVRNVFYETSEGGTLDEFAVLNPPNRVLGGITVRF